YYFRAACYDSLAAEPVSEREPRLIRYDHVEIVIAADKRMEAVQPQGIIPSSEDAILSFIVPNQIACRWEKDATPDNPANAPSYDSMSHDFGIPASVSGKFRYRIDLSSFSSPAQVQSGANAFDIACDPSQGGRAARAVFVVDDEKPEPKVYFSSGQLDAGAEVTDFAARYVPQTFDVRCTDGPSGNNGEGIGYGCKVNYCVIKNGVVTGGNGVRDTEGGEPTECEPAEESASTTPLTTATFSDSAKLCFKAVETITEGIGTSERRAPSQRVCQDIAIAKESSARATFSIAKYPFSGDIITTPPALNAYGGRANPARKSEITIPTFSGQTTSTTLSEGYYKLDITLSSLNPNSPPALYIGDAADEESRIQLPAESFPQGSVSFGVHVFRDMTLESVTGISPYVAATVFTSQEEYRPFRLTESAGLYELPFLITGFDDSHGYDAGLSSALFEGKSFSGEVSYAVDITPPNTVSVEKLSIAGSTAPAITSFSAATPLYAQDSGTVVVEFSASPDADSFEFYKKAGEGRESFSLSHDAILDNGITRSGSMVQVSDRSGNEVRYRQSFSSTSFSVGENILYVVASDKLGNRKVSSEQAIIFRDSAAPTAQFSPAQGSRVGEQRKGNDRVVPLTITLTDGGTNPSGIATESLKLKVLYGDTVVGDDGTGHTTLSQGAITETSDGRAIIRHEVVTNVPRVEGSQEYRVTVEGSDLAGNAISGNSITFTVDVTLPPQPTWSIASLGQYVTGEGIYTFADLPSIGIDFETSGSTVQIVAALITDSDGEQHLQQTYTDAYDKLEQISPSLDLENGKSYTLKVLAKRLKSNVGGSQISIDGTVAEFTTPIIVDQDEPVLTDFWLRQSRNDEIKFLIKGAYDEEHLESITLKITNSQDEALDVLGDGSEGNPLSTGFLDREDIEAGSVSLLFTDKAGNSKEYSLVNDIGGLSIDPSSSYAYDSASSTLFAKATSFELLGTDLSPTAYSVRTLQGISKGKGAADRSSLELAMPVTGIQEGLNELALYSVSGTSAFFTFLDVLVDANGPTLDRTYPIINGITPITTPTISAQFRSASGLVGGVRVYVYPKGTFSTTSWEEVDEGVRNGYLIDTVAPEGVDNDGLLWKIAADIPDDKALSYGGEYEARIEGIMSRSGVYFATTGTYTWGFMADENAPELIEAALVQGTQRVVLYENEVETNALTNIGRGAIALTFSGTEHIAIVDSSLHILDSNGDDKRVITASPARTTASDSVTLRFNGLNLKEDGDDDGAYTISFSARKGFDATAIPAEYSIGFTLKTSSPSDLQLLVDEQEIYPVPDPLPKFTKGGHSIILYSSTDSLSAESRLFCRQGTRNIVEATGYTEQEATDRNAEIHAELNLDSFSEGTVQCKIVAYDRAGNDAVINYQDAFVIDTQGPSFDLGGFAGFGLGAGMYVDTPGTFLTSGGKKLGYGMYKFDIATTDALSAPPALTFEGQSLALQGTTSPWHFTLYLAHHSSDGNVFRLEQTASDYQASLNRGDGTVVEIRGTFATPLDISVHGYDLAQGAGSECPGIARPAGTRGNCGSTAFPQNNFQVDAAPPTLTVTKAEVKNNGGEVVRNYLSTPGNALSANTVLIIGSSESLALSGTAGDFASVKAYVSQDTTFDDNDDVKDTSTASSWTLAIANDDIGAYLFIVAVDEVG
ncbi:TPA: hypothetical protein HA270_06345, partial [Candidatus Woesearchaeota archaeon]|nr:hypothetical protein [Candidatus Woesearchaeota archaeon]